MFFYCLLVVELYKNAFFSNICYSLWQCKWPISSSLIILGDFGNEERMSEISEMKMNDITEWNRLVIRSVSDISINFWTLQFSPNRLHSLSYSENRNILRKLMTHARNYSLFHFYFIVCWSGHISNVRDHIFFACKNKNCFSLLLDIFNKLFFFLFLFVPSLNFHTSNYWSVTIKMKSPLYSSTLFSSNFLSSSVYSWVFLGILIPVVLCEVLQDR